MSLFEKLYNKIEHIKLAQTYYIYDLGENMTLYSHQNRHEKILVDRVLDNRMKLVDEAGTLVHFTISDIDFESMDKIENTHNARQLHSPYFFSVGAYKNGASKVTWTLYPDGRYFEDEDGFGGENCNEVNIYAFIDRRGRILVPFRIMEEDEIDSWRKKAEELVIHYN